MEASKSFDRAQFGLLELPLAERAGLLFLHLGSKPGDLDDQLGDFATLHAPWPLQDLVSTRRRNLEVDCNWKAFLEVFNEYYHLRYVHPKTIDGLYQAPDLPDQTSGSYASQFGETSGTGALLREQQEHALPVMPRLEGRWSRGVRYTWLFPNMTFAAGREALWMYEAYPLGPDRCRVTQTICFPPETIAATGFEDRASAYYQRLDAALEEDIVVLERQQRGLASTHARAGPFAARLEPSVAAFAAWYARQLLETPDTP